MMRKRIVVVSWNRKTKTDSLVKKNIALCKYIKEWKMKMTVLRRSIGVSELKFSYRLLPFFSIIIFYFFGSAYSEIKLALKAQPITFNSMVDNYGSNIQVGPFLKKNEKYDLYFKGNIETFKENYLMSLDTAKLELINFNFLDIFFLRTKGKRYEMGPLLTLMCNYEKVPYYLHYQHGKAYHFAAGPGIYGQIKFKRDKLLTARLGATYTFASKFTLSEDKDSAAWIDTIYNRHDSSSFEKVYHYSDAYKQRLKDIAREYETIQIPIYWNISYTKYAEWIFLGAGVNGYVMIESRKRENSTVVGFNYSTYIHFGIRFGKKSVENENIKTGS